MSFLNRLKSKKGLTGADVAAAITVIVLTVGIVTAIYVNTLNKSKDNLRFANATRIATNIMENIQKKPYEYLIGTCTETGNTKTGTGGAKIFDTKVPNGFRAKVTISSAVSGKPDIARDVTINVTYKTSTTYKTISISSVKEKELMDISNSPDISLIPGYNPTPDGTYYYPVKKVDSSYIVLKNSDITWYDYELKNGSIKYALVYATSTENANVGATITSGTLYAWIPRFTYKSADTSIQYMYGASNTAIVTKDFSATNSIFSYGPEVDASGNLKNVIPTGYNYTKADGGFASDDGLSGVWYEVGNPSSTTNSTKPGSSTNTISDIATDFAAKIGVALPTK